MNGQPRRAAEGGRIDRSRALRFTFNGRGYRGFAGDTLASALVANGVRLVARSFKYHRPRGIMSAGVEETNALVQVGAGARVITNALATEVELYDGLAARSINCWPGLRLDVGVLNNAFSRLLPAGFYYKTFMWPSGMWMKYEYLIRRAAGLGRAPEHPDPDRYERRWDHFDVVVVGGGPAGLSAALSAARAGARVLLAEQDAGFGGALLGDRGAEIDGAPALAWVEAALRELSGLPEVVLLARTTVFGYHDHNYLTAVERVTDHLGPAAPARLPRERLWKVRAREVVLATGAIERPLVFADNDRPGVMLAGAARTYVNRFAALPGSTAVVFTNNDSAYTAAADLARAGIRVAALVDLRERPDEALVRQVASAGAGATEVLAGHAVVGVSGYRGCRGVRVARLDAEGRRIAGPVRRIACDLLANSGGWSPVVHLYSQSAGRLRFDERMACFVPESAPQRLRVAGSANGEFALAECLGGGAAAGAEAARAAGCEGAEPAAAPSASGAPDPAPRAVWRIPALGRGAKRFIDFHNDVTVEDISLAAREGFTSVEHTKRYTTAGMGPDQGKTGNVNALAILAEERGEPIPRVGTTTFRPPYTPVTFGAIAGRDSREFFSPERKTPLFAWHEAHGAVFEPTGVWRRPNYYPRPGEGMDEAVRRECLAVRNAVGITDSSTLGKIDIQGPGSLEMLNRVYTNAWDSLGIGRCRYGLMLGEDGMIFDDGVTSRLGDRHYLMSTTSGGAARVFNWLEEWLQCEWTHLEVHLTSVTTEWASIALAGPRAREVLDGAGTDIDLSPEAFPFMSVRDGQVAGLPARVFRISFSGELSYEINVPAGYGVALWEALLAAGAGFGIVPYGLEAMMVLRTEKGYIVDGVDTDGSVTPYDAGLGWIVSRKKKDFIGRRSLARSHVRSGGRRHLVGLLPEDPKGVLPEGSHIVGDPHGRPPVPLLGNVTSTYYSPALERAIALALLNDGHARYGERVSVSLPGGVMRAEVVKPPFYDAEGARLHA